MKYSSTRDARESGCKVRMLCRFSLAHAGRNLRPSLSVNSRSNFREGLYICTCVCVLYVHICTYIGENSPSFTSGPLVRCTRKLQTLGSRRVFRKLERPGKFVGVYYWKFKIEFILCPRARLEFQNWTVLYNIIHIYVYGRVRWLHSVTAVTCKCCCILRYWRILVTFYRN